MPKLSDKLTEVRDRVRSAAISAGRDPDSVALMAVSKRQSSEAIRELFEAGQTLFGENYLQEALDKQTLLADLNIDWHFIGPIQSNKAQALAQHFSWVHSVDRMKVAKLLSQHRPSHLPPLNICLQINIDDEASKSGATPTEAAALAEELTHLPNLRLRGLMAIPKPRTGFAEQKKVLEAVALLQQQLQRQLPQTPLDTLSMGMSSDLDAAIAAGATVVRIGTALFGERT